MGKLIIRDKNKNSFKLLVCKSESSKMAIMEAPKAVKKNKRFETSFRPRIQTYKFITANVRHIAEAIDQAIVSILIYD
ncbi:MAG: hypothetical protein AMJ61_00095 [Desulfobacterales bacterium SG8_35_2]|nr:MAG: hypothetical protein AMJ61_00095 [Desulfobacterales bacterium SG8_35_2]